MKRFFLLAMAGWLLSGCHRNNTPDVSNIQVTVQTGRFDKYLFSRLDTTDAARGLSGLQSAFPNFTGDFITNILELPPARYPYTDSVSGSTFSELKRFIRYTRPIYDSLSGSYDEARTTRELTQAFKYLRYYFPAYQVPQIITYIGPFNAPGVAITSHAIAIGLQLYAGKDFSFYNSEEGIKSFPGYISRRFEPQYIPTNVMTAVIEDIYPDKNTDPALIEQMVGKGKQWYLLDKLLPDAPDSLKTGYTGAQLKWARENEGLVWNFFLESNDLYTTESSFIQGYIGEAPTTQDMPSSSPGNIGQWVGWQIVKAYADKHPDITIDVLMRTDAKKIFSESKYKPRYK